MCSEGFDLKLFLHAVHVRLVLLLLFTCFRNDAGKIREFLIIRNMRIGKPTFQFSH
jgi:hypothetical protein